MFMHHPPEPLHLPRYVVVYPLYGVEFGVDTFRTLLPHQAQSDLPLAKPRHHVVFHEVHFWKYRSLGEGLAIVRHELLDVVIYETSILWIINSTVLRGKKLTYLAGQFAQARWKCHCKDGNSQQTE